MNKLPTKEKLNFVLCEDIRQEVGNKLTFLGVYAGGDIIFKPGAAHVLSSLAFFFGFRDGSGEFLGRFRVVAPDNATMIESDTGKLVKAPDHGMNFFAAVRGFEFRVLGTYRAILSLDGTDYDVPFDVREASPGETPIFGGEAAVEVR